MMESLLAFKRAGADGILTYFAIDAAKKLRGLYSAPHPCLRARRHGLDSCQRLYSLRFAAI